MVDRAQANNSGDDLAKLLDDPKFAQAVSAYKTGDSSSPFDKVREAVEHAAVSVLGWDKARAHTLGMLAERHATEHASSGEAAGGAEQHKRTKASVDYRPGGAAKRCGNCSMYSERTCSLVAGLIDPDYVCDKWQAKDAPEKEAPPTNVREVQIIRHGATALNNDDVSVDRIRGWKDVPLSPEGHQEAERVADQIAKKPPDVLVSSDLARALDTAKTISRKCHVPIAEESQAFRPWNVGDLAGKKSSHAVPLLADFARNKPDKPVPGGESFNAFKSRFFRGLYDVLSKHSGRVGIVTHHRNERLLKAWQKAGFPADGEIDKQEFTKKGAPTAHTEIIGIPMDRLRQVAEQSGDGGSSKDEKGKGESMANLTTAPAAAMNPGMAHPRMQALSIAAATHLHNAGHLPGNQKAAIHAKARANINQLKGARPATPAMSFGSLAPQIEQT